MPALRWDARLAQVAQDHANACVVTHNRDRHIDYAAQGGTGLVGENIAVGHVSLHGLVSLWADEKRSYVFARVTASHAKQSGHYTQMIWPTTTRIGCALASNRGSDYLVCLYSPKGNVDGRAVGYTRVERG